MIMLNTSLEVPPPISNSQPLQDMDGKSWTPVRTTCEFDFNQSALKSLLDTLDFH